MPLGLDPAIVRSERRGPVQTQPVLVAEEYPNDHGLALDLFLEPIKHVGRSLDI